MRAARQQIIDTARLPGAQGQVKRDLDHMTNRENLVLVRGLGLIIFHFSFRLLQSEDLTLHLAPLPFISSADASCEEGGKGPKHASQYSATSYE